MRDEDIERLVNAAVEAGLAEHRKHVGNKNKGVAVAEIVRAAGVAFFREQNAIDLDAALRAHEGRIAHAHRMNEEMLKWQQELRDEADKTPVGVIPTVRNWMGY